MRRSSLCVVWLLVAAPCLAGIDLFPRANEIFPVLVADPRHIRIAASYYRLNGGDYSDLFLGHSWGLTRGHLGLAQDWMWELDVEGLVASRFHGGHGVNEFETADLLSGLPLTLRRGDVSFKGAFFHSSSYLADRYARRARSPSNHYSVEGFNLQTAVEPSAWLRLYAGSVYLLRTVPSPARWSLQSGVEMTTEDLHWSDEVAVHAYIAEDIQWRERVGWNPDSHLVGGIKMSPREPSSRAMRFQAGWFQGHSPYGEFFMRREHTFDFTVSLEL